jgi:hypothetical protein
VKTIEELELGPLNFLQTLWGPREPFKFGNIRGVIFTTEHEKLYMVEDKLDERPRCKRS